ncbi:hypothetical protein [Oryzifoliimicrobium ureilyticus]|uniref:hypothetical protein n=1 Tax=Oryzifoliimicrobium ureilyticus TaxID=3113724 RepID=UPI0030764F8F
MLRVVSVTLELYLFFIRFSRKAEQAILAKILTNNFIILCELAKNAGLDCFIRNAFKAAGGRIDFLPEEYSFDDPGLGALQLHYLDWKIA